MNTTQATLPAGSAGAPAPLQPRLLDAGRGAKWWGEGWRIFTASPGLWIGILIVLLIILCVLAVIPLLGQIALPLLLPVFAGGLCLGCHALAKGKPLEFGHLFAGFKDGRAGPLIVLGLLALVFNVLITLLLIAVVVGTAGTGVLALGANPDPEAMMRVLPKLGLGLAVLIPLAVILYGVLMMLYWFATPLVAINRLGPWAAMKASFAGSWSNMGALMIYGLLYFVFAIVASIPFALGWLVLVPVLIGSWYAGWREIWGE